MSVNIVWNDKQMSLLIETHMLRINLMLDMDGVIYIM